VQTLEGGKGTTVEIVHESLVHGWPMLRRWLDENQDDVALVDQLRTAARQWATKGREPGLLWRGDTAHEAMQFRARYKGPLSDVERAFLDAVVHHEQSALRRRRAMIIGSFTALSLIVVGAMSLAVIFQRASVRDKKQANEITQQNSEIERQLALVKERELERDKAEAAKKLADAKIGVKDSELKDRARELALKNIELEAALNLSVENEEQAKQSKRRAVAARDEAEKAKQEAVASRDEAVKQRLEAERLRDKEKQRADLAEKTRGGAGFKDLPVPSSGRGSLPVPSSGRGSLPVPKQDSLPVPKQDPAPGPGGESSP
jgi:hypothetical protein